MTFTLLFSFKFINPSIIRALVMKNWNEYLREVIYRGVIKHHVRGASSHFLYFVACSGVSYDMNWECCFLEVVTSKNISWSFPWGSHIVVPPFLDIFFNSLHPNYWTLNSQTAEMRIWVLIPCVLLCYCAEAVYNGENCKEPPLSNEDCDGGSTW